MATYVLKRGTAQSMGQRTTNGTFPDDIRFPVDYSGARCAVVTLQAAVSAGSIQFEGTVDGVNWAPVDTPLTLAATAQAKVIVVQGLSGLRGVLTGFTGTSVEPLIRVS